MSFNNRRYLFSVLAVLLSVFVSAFSQTSLSDDWYYNKPIKLIHFQNLKTVSDLISPVSGTIESVNSELSDDPDMIDRSSWLIEIRTDEVPDSLMTEEEYLKFIESEG